MTQKINLDKIIKLRKKPKEMMNSRLDRSLHYVGTTVVNSLHRSIHLQKQSVLEEHHLSAEAVTLQKGSAAFSMIRKKI